jgi:cytosine deaminase
VVGGIPHFERTMAQGAESVKLLCELAAERGLMVDMHCDESDDPLSRHIETLAFETQRLGLQGRVTGSHCTSMHSMDNYYVSKLLPLMAEAASERHRQPPHQHHPAGPPRHLPQAPRHDPRARADGRRRERGLWPRLRDGPVVQPGERRHAGGGPHGPARGADDQPARHARLLRRGDRQRREGDAPAGLWAWSVGCDASFVLLQARDVVEAIRLRANRLAVWKNGIALAESAQLFTRLKLNGRPNATEFL